MNTLTQQEIKNLPAPPQEWLDEMYPKYDMLPHEIWNKIYDIKHDLEQFQHNQTKCDFWEHRGHHLPDEKVRASLRLLTAKEYQAKSNRYCCPVNEYKLIHMLRELDDRNQLAKVCKKLETQKRPRKETFIEFDRLMNIIKAQEYMDIERIFEYNRIYLEDTTVETNYKKEDDAYWKKYYELEQLCWDKNDKEIKIDRLVSC